jgi:hypothetical protein
LSNLKDMGLDSETKENFDEINDAPFENTVHDDRGEKERLEKEKLEKEKVTWSRRMQC